MSARLSRGLQSLPGGSLLSGSSLSLVRGAPRHQALLRDAVPDARGIIRLCLSSSSWERGVPGLSAVIIWMPVLCVRHVREAECAIVRLFTQAE